MIIESNKYGFCKMFVRSGDPENVRAALTEVLDGCEPGRSEELPGVTVEVLRNPDVSPNDATNFLFWPVLVEVESDGTSVVVDLTTAILTQLWDRGFPTVAACDYEDELPWRGGIARVDDRQMSTDSRVES
jgi:hypothetical protein